MPQESSPLPLEQVELLARRLRIDSVRSAAAANSGHPTSSLSAADLVAVLASRYLRYDPKRPDHLGADHLVFSKGHASPLFYALLKSMGAVDDEQLLSFRKFGSPLEGHPTPVLPWVDVATGSLGQGLPIGVGIALGARLQQAPSRVFVLCGDSEMAEGSIWEAVEAASFEDLHRIVMLVDVNRLGQRGETRYGWNLDVYARRLEAFGWHTIQIDGHALDEIDAALAEATTPGGKPVAILARTVKGQGVAAVANADDAHGKPVPDEAAALSQLGDAPDTPFTPLAPPDFTLPGPPNRTLELPTYALGEKVATRKAYGDALAALGSARLNVVALDGEVGNSTYTEIFGKAHPERFFQMYIAEQQMVAAAVGLQVRGLRPHAATFAAFLSRAYDFVRMAAVSRADIKLCGSHAGVSIGEDGPSQMGLEDLASLRAIHGSVVLYPCCANQTAQLLAVMDEHRGISYLRTTRGATPVIYEPGETFEIGGSRVLRSGADDTITVFAGGITVPEALSAAEQLAGEGVDLRVVDLYSVKPVDVTTVRDSVAATNGLAITVEDHWPEGGLGDAVLDALADSGLFHRVVKLAVRDLPGSGAPGELLGQAGIDAAGIADAARRLAKESSTSGRGPEPSPSPS
ncbi:MAG TPA: transketolase [Acidimicrobiales bacterium]|nr:transketolase [Acidimicrobiales bacterium]